ncbi:AraC family L-rhamnose operon transcriptional activator RhaR [Thermocatellispora tengchongensis]|uniref:AraC family L-rhamnose operon transcriptional activator RhaR n=1 Tax=Thermocatellispora tengchongensis TaxID=1073253 RepID=A0A840P655_9ACTN|nr:AraC family transcriptional regulator [Thermocatellispora tengchongensis]MBB5133341.1 AraC family L-rhamnose operon transcriptional activator RhaR [Thermocatellispora tengchongensis]
MADPPVDRSGLLLHFTPGTIAYAGHYLHEHSHPVHTHDFLEIAVVTGGEGVHVSPAGRQRLAVGDVVLLRPGVWHGYEECRRLDLYNCCFSAELLHRELAWVREDPLLGHLLWTGPYPLQRHGMLTTRLPPAALIECAEHLDALDRLRDRPRHRGDIIGRLLLVLGCLARAAARDADDVPEQAAGPGHLAVARAIRLMEEAPDRQWTLAELAAELHLTRGHLVRRFKAATGLPPMAYLSRFRVELAAALLRHTDQSITQIGEAVGWADANNFARRFKAHYGLTASTYRARFGALQRARRAPRADGDGRG